MKLAQRPAGRVSDDGSHPPTLVVACGGGTPHTVHPGDGLVTIGRDAPAQIRINDARVSRTHVRIEARDDHWVAADDNSTNGVFVNGQKTACSVITDGMTIHLGHADGIPVTFTLIDAEQTTTLIPAAAAVSDEADEAGPLTAAHTDPGVARAGAAVAERREELGYPQTKLAEDQIISQSELDAFERGCSWPHENTRAMIEGYLKWPTGTIAGVRDGAAVPEDDSTEVLSDTVRAAVAVDAGRIVLQGLQARIESLPAPMDSGFSDPAAVLLAELRKLDSSTTNAARTANGAPDVALLLADLRCTYYDLMVEASRAAGATLGQRLYAARQRAGLTAEESAAAAAVSAAEVADAEAERPLGTGAVAALEALVSVLTHR